jgi:predicted acyl esterase
MDRNWPTLSSSALACLFCCLYTGCLEFEPDEPVDEPANGQHDAGLDGSTVEPDASENSGDSAAPEADASSHPAEQAWAVSDPSSQIAAWKAYTRRAEFSVVRSDVRVPMRDGATLACTLTRPGAGSSVAPGKHPGLIVELTPYVILGPLMFAAEADFFTKRGYNSLVCTVRGVGGSDGSWQGAAASQDRRDAHDLVEWLAVQPYSNGRIGQFGESYGAATTYGGAIERPPHLLAIAPQQSPGSLYDDATFPGGVEMVRDGTVNDWPPIAQLTSLFAVSAEQEYAAWHAHPMKDSYWQDREIASRVGQITIPILSIGGWIDGYFRSGTIANIEAALDRTWAFYGQWTHIYPVDLESCGALVPCADDALPSGVLLAWFDRWLMQLDTPVPERPTFVSEEGPRRGTSRWRQLESWLGRDARAVTLQLGSDGTLAKTSTSMAAVRFKEPAEANVSGGSLTFSTDVLARDQVVLGHPLLRFRATLSAPDATFQVQLLDVDPKGVETVVNDGFLKASYRASSVSPTPVKVGEAVDYALTIRPQHYRFVAGHRLRIRLWGGAKDTVVQSSPVEVQVQTGAASTLSLPGWE